MHIHEISAVGRVVRDVGVSSLIEEGGQVKGDVIKVLEEFLNGRIEQAVERWTATHRRSATTERVD